MKFVILSVLTGILSCFAYLPTLYSQQMSSNPFLQPSSLQYEAPHFDLIKPEHFLPAYEQGMAEQLAEIDAITSKSEAPTFDNTIVAMEKTGRLLSRVSAVFGNMTSANSNAEIRDIQRELAPRTAAHFDNIYLNMDLFERVNAVYQQLDELELDGPSHRLVEQYYERFVRAGALLTEEQQVQIRALNEEQSNLVTQFQNNILELTRNAAVVVDTVEELNGMSSGQIAAAAQVARERGLDGKWVIEITNTTRQPVLTSLNNRSTRERVWKASANRGLEAGPLDNRPLAARLAQLRAERADLLGYPNWAAYTLENQMAENPDNVLDMLSSMVPAIMAKVDIEATDIEDMIAEMGFDHALEPWDWEYYAEKVRKAKYDLDENEVRQYFEFNNVFYNGVLYTMNRLYGITFEERPDLPVYHPDVKAYEVFNAEGESIALFYADYFAREGKRGGAWMSSYVRQSHLLDQKPVVVNVMNIPRPAEGEPALISYSNVTTMFHEMGHGIHGMFSQVYYPSQSGTAVPRDFVEFPSTFEEDWAIHPEVIGNYARHYETGELIPAALLERIMRASTFNQGFDTLEYVSATFLDMEWHMLPAGLELQDVESFEDAALRKHGVYHPAVPPRYKSAFFAHIFPGGYSANYYAYIWSEILAADAFYFIQERGGLNAPEVKLYMQSVLSSGGSVDPMELYKEFRGQEPTTDALLKRRGLLQTDVN